MHITTDRSRKIFNNPSPPKNITERQFDGSHDKLKKISKQEWRDIKDEDLWYYFHDLAYVKLDPILFNYLFPRCLHFWYTSLMNNESSEIGDAEFHYSLYRGEILEKMITDKQRKDIYHYFHDGFLERIEREKNFEYLGTKTPAYAWMYRFNSLGYVVPIIDKIWSTWWNINTKGKAISAIMYASGLIYLKGENPIFGEWTASKGGGGPYLSESDSLIYDVAWLKENINFLQRELSVEYIQEKMHLAYLQLLDTEEAEIAQQVASDSLIESDIIQIRIDDLIENLSKPHNEDSWDD